MQSLHESAALDIGKLMAQSQSSYQSFPVKVKVCTEQGSIGLHLNSGSALCFRNSENKEQNLIQMENLYK